MAGATALAVWAGSAWGMGMQTVQLVHVPDAQVASDSVILSEPEDWQAGGKLAIVMVVGPDRERLRARLVSDLLAAHVAVAELMASPHLADPTPLVADAYRTLQELARTAAPGRTMLYGFGWDVSGYADSRQRTRRRTMRCWVKAGRISMPMPAWAPAAASPRPAGTRSRTPRSR